MAGAGPFLLPHSTPATKVAVLAGSNCLTRFREYRGESRTMISFEAARQALAVPGPGSSGYLMVRYGLRGWCGGVAWAGLMA